MYLAAEVWVALGTPKLVAGVSNPGQTQKSCRNRALHLRFRFGVHGGSVPSALSPGTPRAGGSHGAHGSDPSPHRAGVQHGPRTRESCVCLPTGGTP